MKRLFISIFFGLVLSGLLIAQDTTAPSSAPTSPDQQNSTQSSQPQADPATPSAQQTPDSQQTPQTQPTDQPPSTNRQVPAQSSGQDATATGSSTSPKIAPGSVIPAQLTKSIDAKKAKTGDQVVAKVTQDMKSQNGAVIVPKDTKIVGHVTEAQPHTKEQKESQLGIAFDHAVIKNGSEISLPMSIQAIVGQQNPNANAPAAPDQPASAPTASSGGTTAGGNSGMPPAMGRSGSSQNPTGGDTAPSDTQTGASRPVINGQTQGVVGISDLKLSTAASGNQGSVVTSEKNNVKLESGTLLLLKVTQ